MLYYMYRVVSVTIIVNHDRLNDLGRFGGHYPGLFNRFFFGGINYEKGIY